VLSGCSDVVSTDTQLGQGLSPQRAPRKLKAVVWARPIRACTADA
jgi:hypothetical protein